MFLVSLGFLLGEYCALDSSSLCGRAADDHTGVMKKPLSSVVAEETDLEN